MYTHRFAMFSLCIIIHEVSGVSAVAAHNHSLQSHHRRGKSASFSDLTMFSCRKARSVYTNLDFLLILYTRQAVLQVFLRNVYLLTKASRNKHRIQHRQNRFLTVFTLSRKNASRSASSVRQRSRRISLLSLRSLRLCVPHTAACSVCHGKVPA